MDASPQQTISRIRDAVQDAENAGDVTRMRPFFGEDIVLMAPGFPPVVGPEAVEEFMAGFFDQFDVEVSYASDEVVVMGDWAFDRGSARQVLKPKDGSPGMSEEATYLWLYRRGEDGSWRHARVTWNANSLPEQ